MINYFQILGVTEDDTSETIKASYRALAKKYHPDNYPGNPEIAKKKMYQINEAYRTLSDGKLRSEYMQKLYAEQTRGSGNTFNGTHSERNNRNGYTGGRQTDFSMHYRRSHRGVQEWLRYNLSFENLIPFLIRAVVAVSLICCVIHFGPGMFREFQDNLRKDGKKRLQNQTEAVDSVRTQSDRSERSWESQESATEDVGAVNRDMYQEEYQEDFYPEWFIDHDYFEGGDNWIDFKTINGKSFRLIINGSPGPVFNANDYVFTDDAGIQYRNDEGLRMTYYPADACIELALHGESEWFYE